MGHHKPAKISNLGLCRECGSIINQSHYSQCSHSPKNKQVPCVYCLKVHKHSIVCDAESFKNKPWGYTRG